MPVYPALVQRWDETLEDWVAVPAIEIVTSAGRIEVDSETEVRVVSLEDSSLMLDAEAE